MTIVINLKLLKVQFQWLNLIFTASQVSYTTNFLIFSTSPTWATLVYGDHISMCVLNLVVEREFSRPRKILKIPNFSMN